MVGGGTLLPSSFRAILVAIVLATSAAVGAHLASVPTGFAASAHSFVVLDKSGNSRSVASSPCGSPSTCASGLQIKWTSGSCYNGDRFPPVVITFASKGKLATSVWPLIAPCSTAVRFSWDGNHHLNAFSWVGLQQAQPAPSPSVCFQPQNHCGPGRCVTSGCLPAKTTSVDVFFQMGDRPASISWLHGTATVGSVKVKGKPNDLFWYGSSPPKSPYPAVTSGRSSSTQPPRVSLLGRDASNNPQSDTASAPSNANGFDYAWYQPNNESGPSRGCHTIGKTVWTSPPLALAYTANGALDGRIVIPPCPVDSQGMPMPFNDVNIGWSGATPAFVVSALARDDISARAGCQKAGPAVVHGISPASVLPASTLPQPPTGTNGVLFSSHDDNFKAACWTQDGAHLSTLDAPGHVRLAHWRG